METLLQRQRIRKRKAQRHRSVAALEPVTIPKQKRIVVTAIIQTALGKIRRAVGSIDRTALTVAGGLFLALMIIFLLSSIPSLRFGSGKGSLALPPDEGLQSLLYGYVDPTNEFDDVRDIELPAYSLLESVEPTEYVLKRGDTVSEIAATHGVSVGSIISFNGITNVRRIQAGTKLQIPPYDGIPYTVKSGDSLQGIADAFSVDLNAVLDVNSLVSAVIVPGTDLFIPDAKMDFIEMKRAMGELFVWPSSSRWISSKSGYRNDPFTGNRSFHFGIDVPGKIGSKVAAALDGRVIMAGERSGFGKYVILSHAGGYQSYYAHLNAWTARKGQWVVQGQKIGEVGNTGRSTGPHLHFGVYQFGKPLNPLSLLH